MYVLHIYYNIYILFFLNVYTSTSTIIINFITKYQIYDSFGMIKRTYHIAYHTFVLFFFIETGSHNILCR